MNKHHHLPRARYLGQVCVSITACLVQSCPVFTTPDIVTTFANILADAALRNSCVIPVYCFMPEHLHTLIKGETATADIWRVILRFKQITGFWLSKHSHTDWQENSMIT